jgi:hypothetical protein
MPAVRRAARALVEGHVAGVAEVETSAVLDLVDGALATHAGFER